MDHSVRLLLHNNGAAATKRYALRRLASLPLFAGENATIAFHRYPGPPQAGGIGLGAIAANLPVTMPSPQAGGIGLCVFVLAFQRRLTGGIYLSIRIMGVQQKGVNPLPH